MGLADKNSVSVGRELSGRAHPPHRIILNNPVLKRHLHLPGRTAAERQFRHHLLRLEADGNSISILIHELDTHIHSQPHIRTGPRFKHNR